MGYSLLFLLRVLKPTKYTQPQIPIRSIVHPFTRIITCYHSSILYQCAIDSLMTLIDQDHDLCTFQATEEQYSEFLLFYEANKKKIKAEELAPYRL